MEKRLVEIKVLVEVGDNAEVERLTDIIERAICPHEMHSHPERCPYRWFIIQTDLDGQEAANWEDLLNE